MSDSRDDLASSQPVPVSNEGYLSDGVRWTIIVTLMILAVWGFPWRFANSGAAQHECLAFVKFRAKDPDSVTRRESRFDLGRLPDGTRQLSLLMDFSAKNGFGAVDLDTMICTWRRSPGSSAWLWQGPEPDRFSFRARVFD